MAGNYFAPRNSVWKMGNRGMSPPQETQGEPRPATVVDARGLKCPMPVVLLGRRMAKANRGDAITLLTDDPASRLDIPVWCARNGHGLMSEATLPGSDTGTVFAIVAGGADGTMRSP